MLGYYQPEAKKTKMKQAAVFASLLGVILCDSGRYEELKGYNARTFRNEAGFGSLKESVKDSLSSDATASDGVGPSHFIQQRLDHMDRQNTETFEQRYFVNTTYWSKDNADAPVFLCVGGEGPPLDYTVLTNSVHCTDMVELAAQLGALQFAIEHRFYGPSIPNNDLSTENLRYLSTEQAVADIAYFHSLMTSKYRLTSANKWVTFGGSYPGMVAAFARLRLPHLIHASVSSSAPVQAKVNMPEYDDVVASSMAAEIVGGSESCLGIINDGHDEVGRMLKTIKGRRELTDLFNLCNPLALEDERNWSLFAGNGVVYLPVQTNDPACLDPLCNIEKVCTQLKTSTGARNVDKLAELARLQSGGSCMGGIDYDGMLDFYANPQNPERSWIYQTCSEWGFYQTCYEGTDCPFTKGLHTLNQDFDICQNAFGIDATTVVDAVNQANQMYGGDNMQGSRILSVNGEIDPWHTLAILEPPNGDEPALWVRGASHHFWTHESLPTDTAEVVAARNVIWETVTAWLKEEP